MLCTYQRHVHCQGRSLPKILCMQLWECGKCIYANDSKKGAFTNIIDPDPTASEVTVLSGFTTFLHSLTIKHLQKIASEKIV